MRDLGRAYWFFWELLSQLYNFFPPKSVEINRFTDGPLDCEGNYTVHYTIDYFFFLYQKMFSKVGLGFNGANFYSIAFQIKII